MGYNMNVVLDFKTIKDNIWVDPADDLDMTEVQIHMRTVTAAQ